MTTKPRICKPTAAQKRVLELMADGWGLAKGTEYDSYEMIQAGGIGSGGVWHSVRSGTCASLKRKGLIEIGERNYTRNIFFLTKEGMSHAKK